MIFGGRKFLISFGGRCRRKCVRFFVDCAGFCVWVRIFRRVIGGRWYVVNIEVCFCS